MTVIEICVDDADGARAAVRAGADRLEVCVNLAVGGTTPPDDLVAAALATSPPAGVQVLVRDDTPTFVCRPEEVERTRAHIERLRVRWPDAPLGFVVGALTPQRRVDVDAAAAWRDAAGDAPLTFHRAVDAAVDPIEAVRELARLGFDRVLTTGGHASAADGEGLARMADAAAGRLVVLGSGGLRAHNVVQVVTDAGLREVHMRAPGPGGYGTDEAEVARIRAALAR